MTKLPDFYDFGYRVQSILGHNQFGGRITYLAESIANKNNVVVKQFQFARFNSDWLGYKAYQREIDILQQLEHSGIPQYLDAFETSDGFCMVQEYKAAPSLAVSRSYEPEEIKQIAIAILEILVYLQNRLPTVIHRDLKPENILVDRDKNTYLVDFGFARLGGENLAMSSVTLGTLGFMPPEQLYNRQLTPATDLYSLGMTLVCLLTKTKSTEVDSLIDEDNNADFANLLPHLSKRWINWLETLVQRNPKHRYRNAAEALKELRSLYIFKQPEVNLSTNSLEFEANTYGEKITKTITVFNSVADTILQGKLQVAPHPSDPPHTPDKHAWIGLSQRELSSNKTRIDVTVDTSKLLADKNYHREILLATNSYPETRNLAVEVRGAKIITKNAIPYIKLTLLILFAFILSWTILSGYKYDHNGTIFGCLFTAGWVSITIAIYNDKNADGKILQRMLFYVLKALLISASGISGVLITIHALKVVDSNYHLLLLPMIFNGLIATAIAVIASKLAEKTYFNFRRKKFSYFTTYITLAIAILFGASFGFGISHSFSVPALLMTGTAGSLLLATGSYHKYKTFKILSSYRQSISKLIKP